MRAIRHSDLVALGQVIGALSGDPITHWPYVRQYFEWAHAADKYRKRHGRVHRRWGNGSLWGCVQPDARLRADDVDLKCAQQIVDLWRQRAL